MRSPIFIRISPDLTDPLADIVTLLQPEARFSKIVGAAGPWRVRRTEAGRPFYCVVLEGTCSLAADGHEPIMLRAGDFVMIPAAYGFAMSSPAPMASDAADSTPVALGDNEFRLGYPDGLPDVVLLVGYCHFASPDAALLVSLLPQLVHVRGENRLATLVKLVGEESRGLRPAREVVLARLLEVLLIEALRSSARTTASPGLPVRSCRWAPRAGDPAHARRSGPAMDGGAIGAGGSPVPISLFRAVPACGRCLADGISAVLAHGPGQAPIAKRAGRYCRDCRAGGL